MMTPRKVNFLGSDGRTSLFLVKPLDDLRKDMRLMEFNQGINRALSKDVLTRHKGLKIRLFAVIPTSRTTGMLEWVHGNISLRSIASNLYPRYTPLHMTDFYEIVKTVLGNDYNKKIENETQRQKRIEVYTDITSFVPPILHHFFEEQRSSAHDWLQMRNRFVQSNAVWDIASFIIGLGDRHLDNILICESNGEVFHVDFGVLFERGRRLPVPELVPFRLTPNIVDAFGVGGARGAFRFLCEDVFTVIRKNQAYLLSVWESFFDDSVFATTNELICTPEQSRPLLARIRGRMMGGLPSLPQDVVGTVDYLIEEATSIDNLSRMYVGWTPWI